MIGRAWVLTALLLSAAPGAAHAQTFFAERPAPAFTIGPLFVRATVGPKLGPVKVDISFSIVVPAGQSVVDQDLYLLWPGEIVAEPGIGPGEPALEKDVADRGFSVIGSGRVSLTARDVYKVGERKPEALPGGAAFVTFVREGGALGLSSPATWLRALASTPLSACRRTTGTRATCVARSRRPSWCSRCSRAAAPAARTWATAPTACCSA